MKYNIPYGKQDITEEDIYAVNIALRSEFLTQGPKISEFEKAFADYIGCKYAVAVSNGTAALHLSTLALDVQPGDKIITSPITFSASANCIKYCSGEVVFSDIDPETYLLDLIKLRSLLEASPPNTYKGIVAIDFAGKALDMEQLKSLANEFGCWIIEDACHAPGGYFKDQKGAKQYCGNASFADLAVFSFHPVKHIACGEGGMITTNDKRLYEKLLRLRTHGITRDTDSFTNPVELALGVNEMIAHSVEYPGWYMEMQMLGFNYRLTDFQAALGLSQMSRAEQGLKRRHDIAEKYRSAFANEDFLIRQPSIDEGHAYHLYVVEVKERNGLYSYLRTKNIFAQVHYIPCHLMPYYRQLGWKQGDMPQAEEYYRYCLSLPMFPKLTDEEQGYVIETIKNYYNG
jgi:UDP-4-amino-4,6-dideoxy-N-acetyl-beta-L-altrosamine transaminase